MPTTSSIVSDLFQAFIPHYVLYNYVGNDSLGALYAKNISRVKNRNSYTVGFVTDSETLMFGERIYFIEFSKKHSAVVSVLDAPLSAQEHFELTHSMINSHLFPVVHTDRLLLVPVNKIRQKCRSVNAGQLLYIARFTSQIVLD